MKLSEMKKICTIKNENINVLKPSRIVSKKLIVKVFQIFYNGKQYHVRKEEIMNLKYNSEIQIKNKRKNI